MKDLCTFFRIAATVGCVPQASAGSGREPEQAVKAPAAPPAIYDPVPGPFIVPVSPRGVLSPDADEIVANAVGAWRGPKLSTFMLCYQPAGELVKWTIALSALESVTRKLKDSGAKVVVRATRLCDRPTTDGRAGQQQVEITGVIEG